jgi:regulator of sigma E protease
MTIQGLIFAAYAIPLTLIILTALVLVHEWGHFITARISKIRVLEFGIGFPPKAKTLGRDHETEYTLNWLPIGGFCKLEGEDADSEDPHAFGNAKIWRQLVVLVAGVAMNVVLAFVLFWIVNIVWDPAMGVKIERLTPGGAAEKAGLVVGDTVESLDGQRYGFLASESILDVISSHAGKSVTIGYTDATGAHKTVALTLGSDKTVGILGIRSIDDQHSLTAAVTYAQNDPIAAAGKAAGQTATSLDLIARGLASLVGNLVSNPTSAPAGAQGPVGIARDFGVVFSDYGLPVVLILAAVLSANLALVNILPFPPLDGGRMAILVAKKIAGKRGVSAVEAASYAVGFVLLMGFVAWITFFDIIRGGLGG